MNKIVFCLFLSISYFGISQDINRGPLNIKQGGVIDGVVVKDEVPIRSAIPYEHVRLADYVWSKRVFSRIDCREKINQDLFLPYDKFLEDFTDYPPNNVSELVLSKSWIRNENHISLWTIIVQHLMKGDLTMYLVSDPLDFKFNKEDGYEFKYPLEKKSYFDDANYKSEINKRIGINQNGSTWFGEFQGSSTYEYKTNISLTTFNDWVDDIRNQDYDVNSVGAQWSPGINIDLLDPKFEKAWEKAMARSKSSGNPESLEKEPRTFYLTSDLITSYNIKEDWFFDKERSLLDRRIIAIAPVARFTINTDNVSKRGALVVKNPSKDDFLAADLMGTPISVTNSTPTAEYELFWLYFPELRDQIVNYYVYNDKSDAQWMSFDDVFWKRKFTTQVYKVSDKFDRELEDYKYGVDALYEAEKIKDDMRKWEHDVWNY